MQRGGVHFGLARGGNHLQTHNFRGTKRQPAEKPVPRGSGWKVKLPVINEISPTDTGRLIVDVFWQSSSDTPTTLFVTQV